MMRGVIAMLFLNLATSGVYVQALVPINLFGLLPMTGRGWIGGPACLPGVKMAVRHVNAYSGLLDGYNLTYNFVNTECNPGMAAYRMSQVLHREPVQHMILGAGCSPVSEVVAQITHLWNLTAFSYASGSPSLSDRTRFPVFYRLSSPMNVVNIARVALMETFNWNRMATINHGHETFSMVIDDFVRRVKDTDINIISQEIYANDPMPRVENLKKHDVRIIFSSSYENMARQVLCSAYKVGLYGPKVVWMFHGWYTQEWWKIPDVSCTLEQMNEAIDGAFLMAHYTFNPIVNKGISNLDVDEFLELYKQEELFDEEVFNKYRLIAGPCYDNIWVAALALNCTETHLKESGHPKTLADFTYADGDINAVIAQCTAATRMTGVTGTIAFEDGAAIRNVRVDRVMDGVKTTIGTYWKDREPRRFEWTGEIRWKGGNVPRDSTIVRRKEVLVTWPLYAVMSVLAGIGILSTVAFFAFNIYYRNNKIVKMSSPNINNVLLLGCSLTYITVFMETTGTSSATACITRTVCFSLGFTISFSSMLSKTWRVYRIFINNKLLKRSIKDYQLLVIIGVLTGVVAVDLLIWQTVDPLHMVVKNLVNQIYETGNDEEVRPFVRVCTSNYANYFGWTLYIIEGALLSFGAFLAWQTRKVKVAALNDSHQIGMCLYNVVILSAVGLTLSLLLDEQVVIVYGINSGCIIVGTTMTQLILFAPKIMSVYQKNAVGISDVNTFGERTAVSTTNAGSSENNTTKATNLVSKTSSAT